MRLPYAIFLLALLLLSACADSRASEADSRWSTPEDLTLADMQTVASATHEVIVATTDVLRQVNSLADTTDAVHELRELRIRQFAVATRRDVLLQNQANSFAFAARVGEMYPDVELLQEQYDRVNAIPGVEVALQQPLSDVMGLYFPRD